MKFKPEQIDAMLLDIVDNMEHPHHESHAAMKYEWLLLVAARATILAKQAQAGIDS